MRTHVLKGALFVMITALAASALAAEYLGDGAIEAGEDEAAELARAVQNPVASMISLPFQNNTDFDFGPRNGTLNVTNVQPVWPIMSERARRSTTGWQWNPECGQDVRPDGYCRRGNRGGRDSGSTEILKI